MNQPIEASCFARAIRISPSKLRRAIDPIRNYSYHEALQALIHIPGRARDPILKALNSAAANAVDRFGLPKTDLIIAKIEVSEGPTMKRFQPRAQGRAFPILKKTANIQVTLTLKN